MFCVRTPPMKLSAMLVAPAALGLLATGANAAELNINGVAEYSSSSRNRSPVSPSFLTFINRLGHRALSSLVEQYGCVAGYPNGTFRGNRRPATRRLPC